MWVWILLALYSPNIALILGASLGGFFAMWERYDEKKAALRVNRLRP